jgi:hypothetical protein
MTVTFEEFGSTHDFFDYLWAGASLQVFDCWRRELEDFWISLSARRERKTDVFSAKANPEAGLSSQRLLQETWLSGCGFSCCHQREMIRLLRRLPMALRFWVVLNPDHILRLQPILPAHRRRKMLCVIGDRPVYPHQLRIPSSVGRWPGNRPCFGTKSGVK